MNTTSPYTFYGLGIAPNILERLKELNFTTPTPIQHKAIPVAIQGDDLIGIAQTGTGKTLAFAIPLIQNLIATRKRGLILCPTRELASQVSETLMKFHKVSGMSAVVIIGGDNMNRQAGELSRNPRIIIATPGRLIDHLHKRNLSLGDFGVLILDEADRMLDMGFEPQIKKILAKMSCERQTMLFSATMPVKIAEIARAYMRKPLRVEVAPSGTTVERVEQELFVVPRAQKMDLLEKLLKEYKGTILIFSRTKHGAKKITQAIGSLGHSVAEIHSNRSLKQRQSALQGFKSGRFRILVATDIAARGIDVSEIELVINFDLPDNSEDYVHRIGRTARAGAPGKAISFACPEQSRDVASIERLIRARLPVKPLPESIAASVKSSPFGSAAAPGEFAHPPRRRFVPRGRGRGGGGRHRRRGRR